MKEAHLTFHCRLLTPMLCTGAGNSAPELRPSSLKALLRFWWRACQGHLSLEKLKEEETKLFGGTGEGNARKSPLILWMEEGKVQTGQYPLLPHRNSPWAPLCLAPDSTFTIHMKVPENKAKFYAHLLLLSSWLGGLGRRSRRGFGSYQVEEIWKDGKPFGVGLKLLFPPEGFSHNFGIVTETLNWQDPRREAEYPYLMQVFAGETLWSNWKDLVRKISEAFHQYNPENHRRKCGCMGRAKKEEGGRFASPLYVSVASTPEGKLFCLMTELYAGYKASTDGCKRRRDLIEELY